MIQSLISSAKNAFSACSNIVFPPYCVACKESCKTKWFCHLCWDLCQPPNFQEKCSHCFKDSDGLCATCKKKPYHSFIQRFVFETSLATSHLKKMEKQILSCFAVRAFAAYDLPMPDVVLPMSGSFRLGVLFAKMLKVPVSKLLFSFSSDPQALESNKTLLIIAERATIKERQEAVSFLKKCSPKKGFFLLLFDEI